MKIYDATIKSLNDKKLANAFMTQFLKHNDVSEPFYKHKYSDFGIVKHGDGTFEVMFKKHSSYEPLRNEVSVPNGDGIYTLIRFVLDRAKYINKKNHFTPEFWESQNRIVHQEYHSMQAS